MPSNRDALHAIISALESERPQDRFELAARTGLPPARVARYLSELKDHGLVAHPGRNRWLKTGDRRTR